MESTEALFVTRCATFWEGKCDFSRSEFVCQRFYVIFDFGLKAKTHHNIHNKMILITAVTMPKKSKQTIRNKKAAASKKLAAACEQA